MTRREKVEFARLLEEKELRRARVDKYYWLTTHTATEDEQDKENPIKPFPRRDYFPHIIDVYDNEEAVAVEKSRTMMLSWVTSGWCAHEMFTVPYTTVVIQSKDEARAVNCINYIKCLWRNSHPKLRQEWTLKRPLDKQPYNKIELANGSWAIGVSGDPDRIRAMHPTVVVLDEAAFIESSDNYDTAVATRCSKIFLVSSACPGWFREMTRDAKPVEWPDYKAGKVPTADQSSEELLATEIGSAGPIPGLAMRRTDRGIPIIWCHYDADPSMKGERLAKERAKYSSTAMWQQEMEIDYEAKSGTLVYPEFSRSIHVVKHDTIPQEGSIFMGIDPHPRTPHAFLWVMIDKWSDWWVYRELWPSIVNGTGRRLKDSDEDNLYTVKEYADAVAKIEGNRLEYRNIGTEREWAKYIQSPIGERIVMRFMDQAGKAFKASDESQMLETYAARYTRYGIRCSDPKKSHEVGEDAIRALLKPRKHDSMGEWPRIHISDRCPELIYELSNYRYKIEKSEDLERELNQKAADARSHGIDILRYLATAPTVRYNPRHSSKRR